jgi:hypothetical protein
MLKKTSYSSKVQNYVLFCFFKDSTSGVCSVTSTLKLCKLTIPPPLNSIIGKMICYEKVIMWTRSGKSEGHGKVTLYLSPKSEMHHRKVEVVSAQETPSGREGSVREKFLTCNHSFQLYCWPHSLEHASSLLCLNYASWTSWDQKRQFPVSKLKWGLRYTVVKHL